MPQYLLFIFFKLFNNEINQFSITSKIRKNEESILGLDQHNKPIWLEIFMIINNYTTYWIRLSIIIICFMDITIDFTAPKRLSVHQLAEVHYIHSITFIIPFFKLLQTSFSCLYEYISFFNDKPLIKIFIKPSNQQFDFKYNVVAVGGTFDHLHFGHQMLLIYSALSAKSKLIVGITGDEMLQKKVNKELIQSIQMRQNQVLEFVKKLRPDLQVQFGILKDPYGRALDSKDLECLVVSQETQKTGKQINQKRKQKGNSQIALLVCPVMAPISHVASITAIQNKVSSSNTRNHLLAKNGLTVQKFSQYKEIWVKMIQKINQINGQKQQQNHLKSGKWWDIITKYYSQYWRFYHTNNHIFRMFRDLAQAPQMGYLKLSPIDQIILEISIFFHDIIYRTDLKNNQQESANFATAFINQIFGNNQIKKQVIEKVTAGIMTTKTHAPNTEVQKILCELDMAILDSQPEKYQQYAVNIARQYEPLLKNQYPAKRIQFLRKVQGSFKYNWRSGKNIAANCSWEIQHQNQKKK